MKVISLLIILLCCYINSYGEELSLPNSPVSSATYLITDNCDIEENHVFNMSYDYKQTPEWKKYKTLKTLGWCSLGIGVPITAFGIWFAVYVYHHYGDVVLGATTISIGGIVALASIPLFISASRYKHKARQLNLNIELTHINTPTFTSDLKGIPALGLALTF